MNRVFEPSDESGDNDDDNDEDFVPMPKRTQRQQKQQQRTRSRLMAPGVATQTSPRLIQQLEREERRRNFF